MKHTASHSADRPGFANLYLRRYSSGPGTELPEPDPDLFLSVIIPSFKEPDIAGSLSALLNCEAPGVPWEIIVVVNFPENSSEDIVKVSHRSLEQVELIRKSTQRTDVFIHCLWCPDIPLKHAGVGMARKMGMDEAIRRFNRINRPGGIMVAFDADSSCSADYLTEILDFYRTCPKGRTANLFFEHPLEGELSPGHYLSITEYELYLRYFRIALEQAGHPHAIHTVGSSFSVKAETYVRVNGMGRHKAGEDFYFLHKCILLGRFYEINTTSVIPSSRQSDRVIFGTGATIQKQADNKDQLTVYSLAAFDELAIFFSNLNQYYKNVLENGKMPDLSNVLPLKLAAFLELISGVERISALVHSTGSFDTFRKHFFAWFNGFLVLRFLNHYHSDGLLKPGVVEASNLLAGRTGIKQARSARELLLRFRDFERSRGIIRIT